MFLDNFLLGFNRDWIQSVRFRSESNDSVQQKEGLVLNHCQFNAIFDKLTSFSDIKPKTILQVIEIIPSSIEKAVYTANLSDSKQWVMAEFSKVNKSMI